MSPLHPLHPQHSLFFPQLLQTPLSLSIIGVIMISNYSPASVFFFLTCLVPSFTCFPIDTFTNTRRFFLSEPWVTTFSGPQLVFEANAFFAWTSDHVDPSLTPSDLLVPLSMTQFLPEQFWPIITDIVYVPRPKADEVIATSSPQTSWGVYIGASFYVLKEPGPNRVPLWEFYNGQTHLYSTDYHEGARMGFSSATPVAIGYVFDTQVPGSKQMIRYTF
jgi:hypothetical protein